MTTISKGFVGAVAAGALAMVPATGAMAQDRYGRDRGISTSDIITGAVVLGGIAAVAGSLGRGGYDDRYDSRYGDRYDERGYRSDRYGSYNGNSRQAVEQCANAARQDARSRGYGYAEVTQVRDVDNTRYGWKVRGNLQVEGNSGYYDRGYGGYNDGYSRNSRYYDRSGYGRDGGSFTCWIDRGRVSRIDYSGIRGL